MLSALSPSSPAGMEADPVKDVDLSTFMADVMDASKDRLVIVDFWAPWCGPCKQMGPSLEKLVRSYKGAVLLAKIDIDKNQQIAQQMQVQSIPAVFAFFRGQPVDGFMGAQPESQLKSWLDRLVKAVGGTAVPDDLGNALKQADAFFSEKNFPAARSIYEEVLQVEPANPAANAGVLRCLLANGQIENVRQVMAQIPAEITQDKAFDPIRAALELAEQTANSTGTTELQAKVDQNPGDHQARFDLAMAAYAANDREEAVTQLLEIVRRERSWNDEAARKQLVKLFEAFGPTDPITIDARKRLSSILFS